MQRGHLGVHRPLRQNRRLSLASTTQEGGEIFDADRKSRNQIFHHPQESRIHQCHLPHVLIRGPNQTFRGQNHTEENLPTTWHPVRSGLPDHQSIALEVTGCSSELIALHAEDVE